MGYGSFVGCLLGFLMAVQPSKEPLKLFYWIYLTYETCLCYFDNIIIPSSNLQGHCEQLSGIVSHFQKHNLGVKASKRSFGASRVVVSANGVHIDPKKTNAVSQLREPKSVEQVRSFLGPCRLLRSIHSNFCYSLSPPCCPYYEACKICLECY